MNKKMATVGLSVVIGGAMLITTAFASLNNASGLHTNRQLKTLGKQKLD